MTNTKTYDPMVLDAIDHLTEATRKLSISQDNAAIQYSDSPYDRIVKARRELLNWTFPLKPIAQYVEDSLIDSGDTVREIMRYCGLLDPI